ncbi:MAG: hypothetical protein II039_13895, partial [Treponema sp.]|nr:hypothetical protein [Treponema sp.]
ILDAEGTVVEEWVSQKEAHEVKGLKIGLEYTMVETVAPKNWVAEFVDSEGNHIEVYTKAE